MLYGSETWNINAIDIQKIESISDLGMEKNKKISNGMIIGKNEEVSGLVKEERSTVNTTLKRQMQWVRTLTEKKWFI